jgi:ParB-like chromosome segregation protein Spo0J
MTTTLTSPDQTITGLTQHPAGAVLPAMTPDEYAELSDAIATHGQQQPIVIFEDKVLDGWHRYRVLSALGIAPRCEDFAGDELDALHYVVNANLRRRNLTASQRAAVAVDLLPMLEEAARKRQAEAGNQYGKGHPKQELRANLHEAIEGRSDEAAAAVTGASSRYVAQAKRIAQRAPDVLEAVKAGDLNLSLGREIASLDEHVRTKALAAAVGAPKSEAVRAVRQIAQEAKTAKIANISTATPRRAATVRPGEWWTLGTHRLYCGDTAQSAFADATPPAAFAFADPPYGAGVDEWDGEFLWNHDYLADVAEIVAVTPGIANLPEFFRKTAMPYKWSLATWITNSHARSAVGFGNWMFTALFSTGKVHRNAQDFSKTTIALGTLSETAHEGRKPLDYLAWLLETFTKPGSIIIDPFGGSRSTLLVAERLGRKCVMGEIDPNFCAEIIARWERDTGGQAEALQDAVG